MSLPPDYTVQIWDFNEKLKKVRLITLTVWKHALKAELKGIQVSEQPVEPVVRKFLNCPDDYPLELIADHITTSLADIQQQLGIKPS